MKRLVFGLLALLTLALVLPTPVAAQVRTQTAINFVTAELSACSLTPESYLVAIVNASSVYDCDTTGGGTATALCVCDGGTIRGAIVDDIENYVLITFAGQQAITASGAGNDVTVNAADDVILLPGDDFRVTPTTGSFFLNAVGAGEDGSLVVVDDLIATGTDFLPTFSATAVLVAPATTFTASTSILATTPKASFSGVIERAVTNVTVADDAAGTKPAGAIPITTDFATCTCNDATGCTMSIAEPTVTAGYGRSLTIVSIGTGNCEFADSSGVTEIGAALVLEPTSAVTLAYANAAWHRTTTADNVP